MTPNTETVAKQNKDKRKAQFQLISVLSHELKSPLAAVSNYLQLMERQILGADIAAYHEFISRSLVRINDMENLIHDLLDLAGIESGEKPRHFDYLPLDQLLQAALSRCDDEFRARHLQITTKIEPLTLYADVTELNIIINNLLTNAIKYNRDGGNVIVSLKEHAGVCVFSVADTGIGISTQDQSTLFNQFTRIHNEHTQHIAGSGVGLSTVKKLVDMYHGTIQVESTPGDGATFTVLLPMQKPHPEFSF